ncbi:MAG: hypothetical protein HYZ28_12085 [Myxococcales bacterium]|nr:hypothetical protein [Myxococcales bacterium]
MGGWPALPLLGALLALELGCPDSKAAAERAPARAGVTVPLPDGWVAQAGPDHSFRAGPKRQAVLRIDLWPGAGAELPRPEALTAWLGSGLERAHLEVVWSRTEEGASLVRYLLKAGDGGMEQPAMLGAKRVGADLFLCASFPGASEGEVEEAAEACAKLEWGGAPAP